MTHRVDMDVEADFQQVHAGAPFPALMVNRDGLAAAADMATWVMAEKDAILARLAASGAVLFRGFPARRAEDFDVFVRAFGWSAFTYGESLSNAVRVNLTERVFTANEAPPEVAIDLHHELAQTPRYPERLFFFCETAPAKGGETPLCRSDTLYDRLAERLPDFVRMCEAEGVSYSLIMPAADDPSAGQGRSWQSTLGVSDRAGAEARLSALGYRWHWLADGALRTSSPTLPVIRTLADGRRAFFNQLVAAYKGWPDISASGVPTLAFGNGKPLPADAMDHVVEEADRLALPLPWQTGDMLLVDNDRVMHGRRPFVGKRRVLASFALAA